MLTPALKSKLETAASVGVLTFAFAFVGALASGTSGTVPTTLAEWKPILAIAVAAGIASELVYLRTVLAQALAANAGTVLLGEPLVGSASATIESMASSVTSVAKDVAVKGAGLVLLAFLCLASCLPGGAPKPQTVADLKAAEADVLEALPVACTLADLVDPTGATVVCAILDASGAALQTVTKALPTPAIAAAVVAAHPAAAPVAAALRARKP